MKKARSLRVAPFVLLPFEQECYSYIHYDVGDECQQYDERPVQSQKDGQDAYHNYDSCKSHTLLMNRCTCLDILLELHREHRYLADKQQA